MRGRRFRSVSIVTLVLIMAFGVHPAVAGVPSRVSPGGVALENLTIDTSGPECLIRLTSSVPGVPFSLKSAGSASQEVILQLQGAESHLQSRYSPTACPIQDVRVETDPGVGGGIRIHFTLSGGSFSGIDQRGTELVLHFETAAGTTNDGGHADLPEYRIGAGDKLEISVFAHDDLSKIVEVRGDGSINYPLIGNIPVAGKTAAQVDDEITGLLAKDYLVDPQVSVDVREYQSQWVTIIGEVKTPGRYVLKRNMRLIDLLAEAGGGTKEAGADILVTRRQDGDQPPRQIVVSRDRLLSRNNEDANMLLTHGDIVTVSEKEAFYIRGEVSKPGSYYLEKGLTILKAISVAGGLTQFANRKEVELLREGEAGMKQRLKVNLKAIEDGKKPDIPLAPNDVIIVARRIF